MKKKTITYIKNNVEKKVELNKFNYKKVLKEILTIDDRDYIINSDIEYICFNNFTFKNLENLRIREDALCVLENCTFKTSCYTNTNIFFGEGTFEIIDPILLNNSCNLVPISHLNDFSIIFTKDDRMRLPFKTYGFWELETMYNNNGCFSIKDNNNLDFLNLNTKKINLDGNFELGDFTIYGDEIVIGNDMEMTNIITSFVSRISSSNSIKLNNCVLSVPYLNISSKNIFINNVILKSPSILVINDCKFEAKGKENLVLTAKDLSRANLISSLKTYQKALKSQIDSKSKSIIEEYFSENKQEIDDKKREISDKKSEISSLKLELATKEEELKKKENTLADESLEKGRKIKKTLVKKPVTYFKKD